MPRIVLTTETRNKAYSALIDSGLTDEQVINAILALTAANLVFREKIG